MADDKTADHHAQEYLFLQKTSEELDGRALAIREVRRMAPQWLLKQVQHDG